ncbi:hypothetical protein M9980_11780 [Sphingomonas donggukensis]|uniref:PepSY domain-containing protein n=1 Tax=Sphingomonas donggukensis TaxID=2949093 RepID=A0ABY4TS56_9SPHN|nr:hypothetical protein [Sphingomonas donggukensis]URW75215.1 hypothetical protein M9980_11780 [Sphingomonas donggukensis]
MTSQPPPPRYRVVEQGRRLVVIDTVTGAPAARSPTAPEPPSAPSGLTRTAFDGRATLVTHPLYDAKGPRTLTLSGEEARLIDGVRVVAIGGAMMFVALALFFPWLLLAPLAFTDRRVRRGLRAAVTRWLDRYDTPSAG